jgi:DNA-binding response OmpR family regulator
MDAARFDAAVLDANLAGELSQPVATRLEAAGVPYLLLTAYRPSHLPRGFIGVPVLAKPFAPDHLLVALNGLVSPAQPG